jgi:indole-3-glycerol phosphate synthase
MHGCAAARAAAELGIAALVEVHDAAEAERAVRLGARIIGVNARNLDTLVIDPTLFGRVATLLTAGTITVAESGLRTPADVRARSPGPGPTPSWSARRSCASPPRAMRSAG